MKESKFSGKLMRVKVAKKNPENIRMAAEESWLCRMFQESGLDAKEKQIVIRGMLNDHKERDNDKSNIYKWEKIA